MAEFIMPSMAKQESVKAVSEHITPVALTIVSASQYTTFGRKWAYRVGKIVVLNIEFSNTNQITAGSPLFQLKNPDSSVVKPIINNDGTSYNVPLSQQMGQTITSSGFSNDYITSGGTISANTNTRIIGTFVCG